MTARRAFNALVLATLFALPTVASAALVQKWQTAAGVNYQLLDQGGDLDQDGTFELITRELGSGHIAIRSGATGALLAQTPVSYSVNEIYIQNIDSDIYADIIVWESTGKFSCFEYLGGSSLALRWSYVPAVSPPFDLAFADFSGGGMLYLVFMDVANDQFAVYDWNGTQVATFSPGGPTGIGWITFLHVADYDSDGASELLIDYYNHTTSQNHLYLYESNQLVAVEPGRTVSPSVALGPSYPNPTFSLSRIEYTLPTAGPATLRLFDLTGREVRTLVDGQVSAGRHQAEWDGRDATGRVVPAGAYFYELNAGGKRASKRVVRLP